MKKLFRKGLKNNLKIEISLMKKNHKTLIAFS